MGQLTHFLVLSIFVYDDSPSLISKYLDSTDVTIFQGTIPQMTPYRHIPVTAWIYINRFSFFNDSTNCLPINQSVYCKVLCLVLSVFNFDLLPFSRQFLIQMDSKIGYEVVIQRYFSSTQEYSPNDPLDFQFVNVI